MKTSTKHITWRVFRDPEGALHVTTSPPLPWQPYQNIADCGVAGNEFAEANACLIAAAPELLEALELARATITRLAVQHGPFNSSQGTLDVIEAAISKATNPQL